ncbi:MAG: 50S ribosomal protein L21 [Candidatus Brocadiae bacterium]|nr:50S ribosomal protein L21 [Candidatus Brocadiia bacterium]
MYAIIQDGGKQYQVAPGKAIEIELREQEPGTQLEFSTVVFYQNEDEVAVGAPYLQGVKVQGVVEKHGKAEKLTIFKYTRREGYKRKIGYRHKYTRVRIQKIVKE